MGDSWERLLPVGSQPKLSLLTLGSFHCHPTTKGWFGPCARSGFQGSHCWTLFGSQHFDTFSGCDRDRLYLIHFNNIIYFIFFGFPTCPSFFGVAVNQSIDIYLCVFFLAGASKECSTAAAMTSLPSWGEVREDLEKQNADCSCTLKDIFSLEPEKNEIN
jgi:hypothetical protein